MSSILLLQPHDVDNHLKEFIETPTKTTLIRNLRANLGLKKDEFNLDLENRISRIVKDLRICKRMKNSIERRWLGMSSATVLENKIISSIASLVMKLTKEVLADDIKEIDLMANTMYLDPALHPLFDDDDKDILFRWTSFTKSSNNIYISKRRPDATIDHFEGDSVCLHQTYAFGEVKRRGEVGNHHAISKDLIRLGVFSKNVIDAGSLKGVLTFQAVGHQVTFYISQLLSDGLYVMLEIGRIEVPRSLYEWTSYISHLDDALDLVWVFYAECGDCCIRHYFYHLSHFIIHLFTW
ncbi:unnamed protein product [Absidia cylindrospora]